MRRRRRCSLAFARFAQMRAEISHCRCHADVGLIKHTTGRTGYHRTCGHTAASQWNVCRDDDIALTGALRDPVVGSVETLETMTFFTLGSREGRKPELATKVTSRSCRSATFKIPA